MAILLINRDRDVRLSDMLPEIANKLIVLSWPELDDSSEFLYFELIPNLRNLTGYLELRVLQLHNEYKIDTIIAEDEFDLLRAARLREYLGIVGQTVQSAVVFRDKVLMKDHVRKQVKVPRYKRLESVITLYDFINKHHYPVVVKPVDKAGAQGVVVIRNEDELIVFSKNTKITNELMVEEFIDGDMYHVDAFIDDGRITMFSASKYMNGCLTFFETNAALGSYQLHCSDSMYERLNQFFSQVLLTLPTPPVAAYHLEVFHTKDDDLIFCEIASRIGGGYIIDNFKIQYGIDILSHLYRRQCNLDESVSFIKANNKLAGFLMFPTQQGTLLEIPDTIEFNCINRYEKLGEIGKDYSGPSYFGDRIAGIIVEIESQSTLPIKDKLIDIERWFSNRVKWDLNAANEPQPLKESI